jgi:putative cell wall-binding protein/LmbE family N-acetylglucosaminyl deacetylase
LKPSIKSSLTRACARAAFAAALAASLCVAPSAAWAFDPCMGEDLSSAMELASESSELLAEDGNVATYSKSVRRLSGETRYDTMSSIVSAGFSSADTVIIASGENFPDSLSASALAGVLDAPIILTGSDALSQQASDQLARLAPSRAIVLGGVSAISDAVVEEIDSLGISVSRLAGETRYETASLVASEVANEAPVDTVVVANANSPWDSLSISGYCYDKRVPVILTDGVSISEDAMLLIASLNPNRIIILGGANAVSSSVEEQLSGYEVQRWWGQTRYETSTAIAQHALAEGCAFERVALASGENYPDALSGGAFVGSKGGVVLLASSSNDAAFNFLANSSDSIKDCYVLGGVYALQPSSEQKARKALGITKGGEPIEPAGKTVLAFVPHQDDELLTMGAAISKYVALGYDVHVVLCTDGSGSFVRNALNDGGGCSFHAGGHAFSLSTEQFSAARDAEFTESCIALGVPVENVHIADARGVDSKLGLDQAETIIENYLALYPDAEVWSTSGTVGVGQNVDHCTLGLAASALAGSGEISELKCFVEPYLLSSFVDANPEMQLSMTTADDEDLRSNATDAAEAYCSWDPSFGRYAIGCHSVGGDFSIFLNDPPTSLWYEVTSSS